MWKKFFALAMLVASLALSGCATMAPPLESRPVGGLTGGNALSPECTLNASGAYVPDKERAAAYTGLASPVTTFSTVYEWAKLYRPKCSKAAKRASPFDAAVEAVRIVSAKRLADHVCPANYQLAERYFFFRPSAEEGYPGYVCAPQGVPIPHLRYTWEARELGLTVLPMRQVAIREPGTQVYHTEWVPDVLNDDLQWRY